MVDWQLIVSFILIFLQSLFNLSFLHSQFHVMIMCFYIIVCLSWTCFYPSQVFGGFPRRFNHLLPFHNIYVKHAARLCILSCFILWTVSCRVCTQELCLHYIVGCFQFFDSLQGMFCWGNLRPEMRVGMVSHSNYLVWGESHSNSNSKMEW